MPLKKGEIIEDHRRIRQWLAQARSIAIVGVSPKPERDSHEVARYLQDQGYRIFPVRPAQKEILGTRAYKNLDEIASPVDIVDLFRSGDQIMGHVPEILRLRPGLAWMQLGIENRVAAGLLTDEGIDVVMNRCIKRDHEDLFKKNIII